MTTETQTSNQRLPFDLEYAKHAESFCNKVIDAVPELLGVAIVPLWHNQPENTPAGVVKFCNKPRNEAAAILTLIEKLTEFSGNAQRALLNELANMRMHEATLERRIEERVNTLNELNKRPEPENDNAAEQNPNN
ncbi:hypothetical protein EBZ39_05485 [bacterium]|nr:hypothetical protein [bacterium]